MDNPMENRFPVILLRKLLLANHKQRTLTAKNSRHN